MGTGHGALPPDRLGFGACRSARTTTGEVVFNTAMTGYQESLTDPSYAGQILTMTAPQIGNYGVSKEDLESSAPQVAGFVIRELSRIQDNYRSGSDLDTWLADAGVLGIEQIDTRALVRIVRVEGALRGVISCDPALGDTELVDLARASASMAGANLAAGVSGDCGTDWNEGLGEWRADGGPDVARRFKVVALDCGAKRNILRNLAERGCDVTILPWDASADAIRAAAPDGLFVSNGPGDPAAVEATIATLRGLVGELPIFGICLGHQMLALAMGATSFKLPFGHRGANQPVRNVLTGAVEISSQNHGFCVDPDSLAGADCEVTHVHLNDGTLAGFRHCSEPILAVQYHPEASPGPHDSAYLFDCFVEMMATRQPISAERMTALQALYRTSVATAAGSPAD
ncbi:MAG: glutamine-hydrolyzing carbamoyl-phosphate synthase small subunit [Planctomycetota bacterium]